METQSTIAAIKDSVTVCCGCIKRRKIIKHYYLCVVCQKCRLSFSGLSFQGIQEWLMSHEFLRVWVSLWDTQMVEDVGF